MMTSLGNMKKGEKAFKNLMLKVFKMSLDENIKREVIKGFASGIFDINTCFLFAIITTNTNHT